MSSTNGVATAIVHKQVYFGHANNKTKYLSIIKDLNTDNNRNTNNNGNDLLTNENNEVVNTINDRDNNNNTKDNNNEDGSDDTNTIEDEPVTISYPTTEVIGHGSFGVVFTTTIIETNELVAIKKVLQDKRFKNRELEIMKLINHKNVINLKYFFYEKDSHNEIYLNLIIDYMPQSLYQRLRHFVHQRSPMPRFEIKCYMYQIFKALNYLHNNINVCHRDIKPQNLLVNPSTFELKICDFGSAKQLKITDPNVSYICSRYYRAPELIFGSTNYTNQIDIWSTGCVMAELLLGQPMFPGESGIDQLVEIIKILGTPSKQDICAMNSNYMEHKFPQIKPIPLNNVFKKEDEVTVSLLTNILKYDPMERLNSLQCLCQKYFDELRIITTGVGLNPDGDNLTINNEQNLNLNQIKSLVDKLELLDFNVSEEFNHLNSIQLDAIKLKLLPNIIPG
ncbi:hypothetical protein TPHA_0G02090 [Tetrapisispora phaffii CBS 4417]|uniref:non-specific serine/threonine protein kinase n=1 Tax=Tetrapisispora phaffii (strain ATCC 24235 / CBS 4417 / NBRC 1672 / NRRL Y-8282 / UCD 70-5) TaxID=1071381 RepID=G8BVW7_TETPH|nr:hypothetical protein TPHA_0G02090 [Tetrapisispora phaffii CBS 4417]CCE64045.1 hypothetical protein TPHA_0G02090 [Tetrapisispora phaffii CBS 4417]